MMARFGSASAVLLLGIMGILALGAGVGVGYWRERANALAASPDAFLNPECRSSVECMAIECGGRSFVVSSDIAFGTVEAIRNAWCEGVPATGLQSGVRCSSYHRCVLGGAEAAITDTADLSAITDLAIVSVDAYPNVASVFITWRTNAPTTARVTITKDGTRVVAVDSAAGVATDHYAQVTSLESNTLYGYRIEASFQRGATAGAEGTFRVLPAPSRTTP